MPSTTNERSRPARATESRSDSHKVSMSWTPSGCKQIRSSVIEDPSTATSLQQVLRAEVFESSLDFPVEVQLAHRAGAPLGPRDNPRGVDRVSETPRPHLAYRDGDQATAGPPLPLKRNERQNTFLLTLFTVFHVCSRKREKRENLRRPAFSTGGDRRSRIAICCFEFSKNRKGKKDRFEGKEDEAN